MNYRCPKCQSTKIMPKANALTESTQRPFIPKSLLVLVPSVLTLIILGFVDVVIWLTGHTPHPILQSATAFALIFSLVAGALFYRVAGAFKDAMQQFMQSQKQWKCRNCGHEWQSP